MGEALRVPEWFLPTIIAFLLIGFPVAVVLRVTLLEEAPRVEETNPEAYALVLRARHLSDQSTLETMSRADELFREALVIDPDYAAAWSGLAWNHYLQVRSGAPWDSLSPLMRVELPR